MILLTRLRFSLFKTVTFSMLKQYSWPNNALDGNGCLTTDIICCYACWSCYGVGNVHQRMGVIQWTILDEVHTSRELKLRAWVIGRHGTWSALVQLMAWCLIAPSHYLNQCGLSYSLISCGIHLRANSLKMLKISIIRICGKITFKMTTYLRRHLSLKWHAGKPIDINF